MMLSAALAIPASPRRVATTPSFITPSPARSSSSQWLTMGMSKPRAYSMARRIMRLPSTGRPSSEKATAPASFSSANSLSCSPFKPRVMEATG